MSVSSAKTIPVPEAHELTSRVPVLFLLAGGIGWLIVGLALSLLASLKLHAPECLPFAWAGVGRLEAAAHNVLLLGAGSQMGLAIALWLLVHLGRTELVSWGSAVIGAAVWNLALAAGVPALLLGGTTGVAGMELPAGLASLVIIGYLLVAANAFVAFARCRRGNFAPSQWFVFGAVLWFSWLHSSALLTAVCFPGRGVLSALSAGWFVQGSLWLWLVPLALAALYHFVPELTGRPLRSPELAPAAFWTVGLFGGWTAALGLVGGPLPAWVVSVSVVAGVLLLIPVLIASVNLHIGSGSGSVAGRFAKLAVWALTLGGIARAATALRCSNSVLHFTVFEGAVRELLLLGFVSATFLAGAYVLVPRLVGRKFPNAGLASLHFGLSVLGVVLVVAAGAIGGWKQGWLLADPAMDVSAINLAIKPWLRMHTAGLGVFFLGQLAFAGNVLLLIASFALPAGRTLVTEVVTGTSPAPAAK